MSTHAVTQLDPRQVSHTTAPTGTGTQRLDPKVSGVAISNDLEGRLSVTTAEGDKITLTADLEYDFRTVSYASKVQTGDGTVDVQAKYMEASLKREFGVTVEGNLNEQELKDLEKLFRKVSNMFRKYFSSQDEAALAKTTQLSERFGHVSSLSSVDLTVDVERSVTVLAAQIASDGVGQPALPSPQGVPLSTAPIATDTPGGAPATAAVIPQPSTGTTAPTPSSSSSPAERSAEGIRLTAQTEETEQPASLIQQVLDSLQDTRLEPRKIQQYLPSFFQHLREELVKELQRGQKAAAESPDPSSSQETPTTSNTLLVAYQTVRYTSISLSIHS